MDYNFLFQRLYLTNYIKKMSVIIIELQFMGNKGFLKYNIVKNKKNESMITLTSYFLCRIQSDTINLCQNKKKQKNINQFL